MNFNSLKFLLFCIVVFPCYYVLYRWPRAQNAVLLIASYTFYGYWDYRFLALLAASTLISFYFAERIPRSKTDIGRKAFLWVSVGSNLVILGFFKYFNFFADSFISFLSQLGMSAGPVTLQIILPVGISFYTFQAIGYTVDVYRNEVRPAGDLIEYALFISFFPQLVAGPIERAAHILPQIRKPRKITAGDINDGLFLVLWGLFKKIVIADNCGIIADTVFDQYGSYSGIDLLLGSLAFTLQIYGDFSGYSDIARGLMRMMGFDLMINFKLPYLATSPRDFWRRWHISLSTWLRDYLYIPLGGNRNGTFQACRNLMATMLLGGLWHGASWNFALWGGYHGSLMILLNHAFPSVRHRLSALSRRQPIVAAAQIAGMFCLTVLGWILFRSKSLDQIVYILTNMGFQASPHSGLFAYKIFFVSVPLLLMTFAQSRTGDLLIAAKGSLVFRSFIYAVLINMMMLLSLRKSIEFLYFQF